MTATVLAPCGHTLAATYRPGKCELPICAGDREASERRRLSGSAAPPWFCDPVGWARLHPTTRSVFEEL